MKVLIQRVCNANVVVDKNEIASIGKGYLLLVGIEKNDNKSMAEYLAKKISNLRIFSDENDKMNLSIQDVKGEILAVSQFTLAADLSRGNRPGFDTAAHPDEANKLYEYFVEQLKKYELIVKTGIFQADMKVSLINDGPCTFILQK